MRTILRTVLVSLALLAPTAAFAEGGADVFKSQNCTSCHSVSKAGISRAANPDEKAMDLSDVGTRHDKKWIAQFLLKKVEREGEKHKKGFQGTTEELKVLATWLETLK